MKAELLAAARMDAMGRVRGTDIASIQTSLIASANPHDSGMSDSFRSFSQSLIAGRWAGDADLPLFTPFIGRDGRPWMRAEVSGFVFPVGYERNIAKCFISLSGKSEEQTVFREGEAFSIHLNPDNPEGWMCSLNRIFQIPCSFRKTRPSLFEMRNC
ncbi:MAG: hypothetical protein IPJ66_13670 [Bacteroidetes bacterium]|nr:hypothetical protein [Bacteroidota bacterium]